MLVDLQKIPPTFCSSGPRAGSSFVSSFVPPRPGSSSLTHERIEVSHALHHHQPSSNSPGLPTPVVPGIRRFDGPRSLPAVVPAPLQHDQNSGFYVFPPSSSVQNVPEREWSSCFPSVFRDSNWGSFSDLGNRSGSFWNRHSS